jgi:hypothetical protein
VRKLVFNKHTLRGVDVGREPVDDEFTVLMSSKNYAWFIEYPSRYQYIDGVFSECPAWATELAAANAIASRRAIVDGIRGRYAKMLSDIAAPYGPEERETWKTQEEEALQWQSDNTAPCVMIRAMATTRGITMELMVEKILENAALFRAASGRLLGAQQKELADLESL